MKHLSQKSTISLLTVLGLTLAACGGSDDSASDSPGTALPDTEQVDDEIAADTPDEQATDEGDGEGDDDAEREAIRPSRDELCTIVEEASDELAALAGLTEIEERAGTVIGRDCAVTSTSVGYVSLSLLPAVTQSLQDAANSIDGVQSTSPGLIDGILIEDPGGLTQHGVFELDGAVYLVQVESDAASTLLSQLEEIAIQLRFRVANR
ncbi:MAG: hypothetical protein AB8G14_04270 [Ilumatobacter sp.]